jgi:hypothetical protein
MTNMFTETYLRNLAADRVQGDFTPFNQNDIYEVEAYIKGMLGRLSDNKSINVQADFDNYGSGFASYINVKITKKDKSDTTILSKKDNRISVQKNGLLLYICSLSLYWYFGGAKWTEDYLDNKYQGGSMPFLMPEHIHDYDKILWHNEIEHITRLFENYRYSLLTEQEVEKSLWFKTAITTIIGQKPYTVFDCFFHWED